MGTSNRNSNKCRKRVSSWKCRYSPIATFFSILFRLPSTHTHKKWGGSSLWGHMLLVAPSLQQSVPTLFLTSISPPYYHPPMPPPLAPIFRASRGNRFSASDSSINSNVSAATCHQPLSLSPFLSCLLPVLLHHFVCIVPFRHIVWPTFSVHSRQGGLMVRAAWPKNDGLLAAFLAKFIKCILKMRSSPRSSEYC